MQVQEVMDFLGFRVQTGLLAGGAILFYLVYRNFIATAGFSAASVRRKNTMTGMAVVFAFTWSGFLGLVAVSTVSQMYPATDADIFSKISTRNVLASKTVYGFPYDMGPGTYAVLQVPKRVEIAPVFPPHVLKDSAFDVVLRLEGINHRFPSGGRSARLRFPSAFEVIDKCSGAGDSERESTCTYYTDSPFPWLQFSWSLTPVRTGNYTLLIDNLDLNMGLPKEASDLIISTNGSDSRKAYAYIDDDAPKTIKLDIEVLTTLGIGQRTYDILKVIGSIVTALLGTGFVLKLLRSSNAPGAQA